MTYQTGDRYKQLMSPIRKWTWTVVRLVILTLLITGVVEVILLAAKRYVLTIQSYAASILSEPIRNWGAAPPGGNDYSPYRYLTNTPELATKVITYKRLHLDVDSTGVSATYDVYLPKNHELFALAETSDADSAQKLANEVLGAVKIEGLEFLKFDRIETSISPTDDNAHIVVNSSRFAPNSSVYRILVGAKQLSLPLNIASKEVIVHTRDVTVRSSDVLMPISKTPDETIYIFPDYQDDMQVVVQLTNPPAPLSVDQSRPPLGDIMKDALRFPGDRLWYGILASLPFLLFLYWNHTRVPSTIDEQWLQRVDAVKTYLIFHFSYFFFYGLEDLINEWRDPFLKFVSFLESRTLYVFAAHEQHFSYVLLPMMAMFIYVWPAVAHRSDPDKRSGIRRAADLIVAVLAIAILVALSLYLFWAVSTNVDTLFSGKTLTTKIGSLSIRNFYWLFLSGSMLILYVLCLLLATAQTRTPRLRFALIVFLLLSLLIAGEIFDYAYPFGPYRKYYGLLSVFVYVLAAFLVVRVFASIFYQAITGRDFTIAHRTWSWKKRLIVGLGMLVVAVSTLTWQWPMSYWQLWSLAWELRTLFLAGLVWILVDYIRQVSEKNDWLSLPQSAREAGILLSLSMFYSPTTRWKYIPVSFIAGYFLLKYWLLPKKQFDRSVFTEVKAGVIRLIERVIAYNDAERALKTLKKELLTKLGKGEIEPPQYTNRIEIQRRTVGEIKEEITIHNQFAKDLVLAFGPGNSAWQNGKQVAIYSLLFSIPWQFLYLRDLVQAPSEFQGYLILDVLIRIIMFVMPWLSYGFIFGYFYPHIRGHNGIQKGLALFVTLIIPDFIWTALALPLDRANWISFTFWVLQIFVQSMLLGMIAGDFAIMRANGFKWGQLLEFYRLSSLSAWASSVILAVAAAASTLLTSGATQIITTALKYMGVTHDDIPGPPK